MSGIPGLDVKHVIGGAVAASAVAVALAGGGFEPTAFAAAGLVVWIAVVVGLAVGVLPRSQPPTAALVAGISLAGLAALIALSLAWASDDGNGFEDVVRTLAYLGAFAAVVLASRRSEATPWLAGLAVGLAAIAAIALLARFEPSLFGNPDADLADLPAVLGRLTYPIGYWNGLAAVMAAAIVLLYLVRRDRRRGPRARGRGRCASAGPARALDDRLSRWHRCGGDRLRRPARGRPAALAAARQPRPRGRSSGRS